MATLKDPLPRDESEIGANRAKKGDKSYYYAHGEGWEVPADAKVRVGPGIVNSGTPVRLGEDGQPISPPTGGGTSAGGYGNGDEDCIHDEVVGQLRSRVDTLERELAQLRGSSRNLSQFSFSDEGGKCKVYLEVGPNLLERRQELPDVGPVYSEAAITVTFGERSCCVRVLGPAATGAVEDRRVVNFVLESETLPQKCSYKVDRTKGRITLTFKKKDELKKWRGPTTKAH